MDENEVRAQIVLGTFEVNKVNRSKAYNIIRKSDDPKIIKWAFTHKDGKIRAAAVKHPLFPLSSLLKVIFFEENREVIKAAGLKWDWSRWIIPKDHPRYVELESLIEIVESKYDG